MHHGVAIGSSWAVVGFDRLLASVVGCGSPLPPLGEAAGVVFDTQCNLFFP